MSYVITPRGNLPIDPAETCTLADAERICKEIGAESVQEYVHGNKDESIVYSDDRKIYQIMPGFQSAAQLRNAQAANPVGHWEGGPGAAFWVVDAKVAPKGPDAGSAAAPNVDPFAGARGQHTAEDCYQLLLKIAAKLL